MWTDILIFLSMSLALCAIGFVIWLRREARKDGADKEAARRSSGGKGEE
jgi:hypothetical protein